MRQLAYTMHFRGQASPSAENEKVLRITASATSSIMETIVSPIGVEMALRPAPGDMAFLEFGSAPCGRGCVRGEGRSRVRWRR